MISLSLNYSVAGANGLLVYYPFNEVDGAISYDSSGNNIDGRIFGASRVKGKTGNGLLFGLDDSRLYVTEVLFFYDQITIEAWIKPNNLEYGETYRIIGDYNYAHTNFQIRDKKLEICYNGTSYHLGEMEIPVGVWSRVAFTSDGTTIKTYINSVLDKQTTITLPLYVISNVAIGANRFQNTITRLTEYKDEFPGIIDEFKIWNLPDKLSPCIEGIPSRMAWTDELYSFTPAVIDTFGDTLSFSISGKPDWADFDTSTGELSGIPNISDIGISGPIKIVVRDQDGNSDSLTSFTITIEERLSLPGPNHLLLTN